MNFQLQSFSLLITCPPITIILLLLLIVFINSMFQKNIAALILFILIFFVQFILHLIDKCNFFHKVSKTNNSYEKSFAVAILLIHIVSLSAILTLTNA